LARTYAQAAETATVQRIRTGTPVADGDDAFTVPVTVTTRLFGTIRAPLRLPVSGDGEAAGVDWRAALTFPGLRRGERLRRETEAGPRGDLLARDGTPLARGPDRSSPLGALASEIAGTTGPIPAERARDYARRGIPPGTVVGLTGLEREFDLRLVGTPGGTLLAGDRVLARKASAAGADVRTSIDLGVQRAAVDALAGRYGGVAVLRPRTGEVLALAGIAYSAPQPPGSTFKIITLAGALQAGTVKRSASFERQTATTLEGVRLENANGEVCGGSLAESFAESCNSVFAPIGADLGARRLVAVAERFGFNERPSLAGAARSTIPAAGEIGDDLAVGSTAIGQGKVLATPLLMASVAATIAEAGRRRAPSLLRGGTDAEPVAVVPAAVARTVRGYMRRVVRSGTGVKAAIPGVSVAGKTGTAELRNTTREDPATGADVPPGTEPANDMSDTDAWFTAFAPSSAPRVAVAVMLVGQGAGGETAAPVARAVLQAALKR
jgi:cell division protein FtsI/penicillin-binding protein 2